MSLSVLFILSEICPKYDNDYYDDDDDDDDDDDGIMD